MNILSTGYNSIYDSNYTFRHKPEKNSFLLILTKSNAVFRMDGINYRTPPFTFVLYDDTVIWEYSADNDFLICDWLCFEKKGDTEFFESIELPFNKPVQFADVDFISNMMRNIACEYYSIASRRLKMTDTLMKTLLFKISDSAGFHEESQQTVDPHYSALMDLREKIYRNPQMRWNVDSMANYVNMSRSYFQHIYKEMFGVSCISDVISGKIEKAKEILSETSCTVSQVATMCGYDNEEHFMRQFKKIVGVTPTKYRHKI
ncbi:MAG: AraC family transcriptional regulator [Ruminococcus sp.]|nr:AraC family transcriptional regulator [Ruminococcus sp.]